MESPQGAGATGTKERKFLAGLTFGWQGHSLEECNERVQKLLEHAEEMGLTLIEGDVTNSRERDPVERISYASDGIWRNTLADEGHFMPVDAVRFTAEQAADRDKAEQATGTPAGTPS